MGVKRSRWTFQLLFPRAVAVVVVVVIVVVVVVAVVAVVVIFLVPPFRPGATSRLRPQRTVQSRLTVSLH